MHYCDYQTDKGFKSRKVRKSGLIIFLKTIFCLKKDDQLVSKKSIILE